MRRTAFVTLAVALGLLSLAGCGGGSNPPPPPPPCDPVRLLAYWAPGGSPQAGFQVQGLVDAGFPAQLGCAQAGVVAVRVFAGTPLTIVPCPVGAGLCAFTDTDPTAWRCDLPTGGIQIPVTLPGTYDVQIEGYGENAVGAKYTQLRTVTVGSCGDTAVGVFPQGLNGPMDLEYSFIGNPQCNPTGSFIEWDLFHGTGPGATRVAQGSVACGGPNPFPVSGGASLAAGVYTLRRIAEVVPGIPPAPDLTCRALGNTVIVHAGDEVVGGTAPVFLELPAPTCP